MDTNLFIKLLKHELDCSFFTGVPDSQLKELCYYLAQNESDNHLICANEGNAVAVAAGEYLSSGRIPVVYLQNSGLGNIVNPVASLLNNKVYGIPCVFVVGWRGEPGVKDEPQHIFQGEITLDLLKVLGIHTIILDKDTDIGTLQQELQNQKEFLNAGNSIAIVVKKGAFSPIDKVKAKNNFALNREAVIKTITEVADQDLIVCTTGKASRELFEIRENAKQSHKYDFLTVGSMGHASSIAYGISKNVTDKKVWCIDGDGAILMHLGAMAIMGNKKPNNLIHVLINNQAHETVGGMATSSNTMDYCAVAKACGYLRQYRVSTEVELKQTLLNAKNANELTFVEICVGLGSRADLGRPTTTPEQNKNIFMNYIRGEK